MESLSTIDVFAALAQPGDEAWKQLLRDGFLKDTAYPVASALKYFPADFGLTTKEAAQ